MPMDIHHPYPNSYSYCLERVWITRFSADTGRVYEDNIHFTCYPGYHANPIESGRRGDDGHGDGGGARAAPGRPPRALQF